MSLNMLLSVVISAMVISREHPVRGDRILLAGAQLTSHLLMLQEVGQALSIRGHSVYLVIDENYPNQDRLLKRGITAVTFHHSVEATARPMPSERGKRGLMSAIMRMETHEWYIRMKHTMQDCTSMMLDEAFISKVTAINVDIVLYDGFVLSPCNVILANFLSVPAVFVTSMIMTWDAMVPVNPAVTPAMISRYSDRMTFSQRLVNVAIYLVGRVYRVSEQNTTLLKRFAPEVNSWLELQQRSTLLYIVTRDYLLEWPEPQMPNVIYTPGITTHPAGGLPQQLKELMDAATDGAIILSFGSSTFQFPAEINNKFLVAFSKLKQTIIYQFGGRNTGLPSNVSKNVHLLPWLPQNDLLGHPNTLLFITHCGNNGQYESLYHGVPMIGFPMFAEQHHNAFRMVEHGYGIEMDFLTFTADELVNNIYKVLDEKSFKMATQKSSGILKSRPMTAQDTAAYWVEHVLKYGGEHLRTGAMDMPLYQFLMLDILLFMLVVCFLSGYILKTIFTIIWRKCLRKQSKQKQH